MIHSLADPAHQMVFLSTPRLHLRHFHILDADALYRVFGDPEVMRFGDGPQTRQWVQSWLETCLEHHFSKWGFGAYAVVQNENVIGYCGLFFFPDIAGQPEVEIGYRLERSAWGQGYATEAARAVRDYAFATLGIGRVIALIDPANLASIRVAEKLGMHYEKEVMLAGYTHPDHVYVVTRG